MQRIQLATGLARRGNRVLLVASRYANHSQPLWNLPGGRQEPGELLTTTVEREIAEETGLRAHVGELLYVSESYDAEGDVHVLNATFAVDVVGRIRIPEAGDHVVEASWVAVDRLAERIAVAVVREPLLAHLGGSLDARYAGFERAGVTIRWPTDDD